MATNPKPYDFTLTVQGDDILVTGGIGTRFGGTDDDQDNGQGAGGFNVSSHPKFLGVSLPIRSNAGGLSDSPLPRLPITHPDGTGGIEVIVTSRITKDADGNPMQCSCRLVDIGPSKRTGRSIDLMNSVVLALHHTLKNGTYPVDYRVVGGAKYLPKAN